MTVLIYFHFPALRLVLLFLVCSQFQMLLIYLAGPRMCSCLGLMALGMGWDGASGTLLDKGKMNEV